nr:hypothetical protein [Anaerococcus mediterraneensis]
MLRLLVNILFALEIILIILGMISKYKENRERLDLIEIFGICLMVPFL